MAASEARRAGALPLPQVGEPDDELAVAAQVAALLETNPEMAKAVMGDGADLGGPPSEQLPPDGDPGALMTLLASQLGREGVPDDRQGQEQKDRGAALRDAMARFREIDRRLMQEYEAQRQAQRAEPDAVEPVVRTYVVQPGDNLWDIAESQLGEGQGHRYTEIFGLNKAAIKQAQIEHSVITPDQEPFAGMIYPGIKFVLPGEPAAEAAEPPPGTPG